MRAFVALNCPRELSKPCQAVLAGLERAARGQRIRLKLVSAAHLHLTLKFLGEVALERYHDLYQALRKPLADLVPIHSSLLGLGAFPRPGAARVIVLKLSDPGGQISELASLIEQTAVSLGFAPEGRPFSPHITLGRLRAPKNVARLLSECEVPLAPVEFRTVTFFESQLSAEGPRYSAVHEVSL